MAKYIVASQIKKLANSQGHQISKSALQAIDARVYILVSDACKKAQSNKRVQATEVNLARSI